MLVVKSLTVMTCKCESCGHSWASALEWLPLDIQERIRAVVPET
jgi:hypothetical protein